MKCEQNLLGNSGIYFIARSRHFEFLVYLQNQNVSHDALIRDMAYWHGRLLHYTNPSPSTQTLINVNKKIEQSQGLLLSFR